MSITIHTRPNDMIVEEFDFNLQAIAGLPTEPDNPDKEQFLGSKWHYLKVCRDLVQEQGAARATECIDMWLRWSEEDEQQALSQHVIPDIEAAARGIAYRQALRTLKKA